MISTDPWVWLSAFMTLCSFMLLYGEHPLFRIGEYTYTGTVVAHSVVTGVELLRNRFKPLYLGTQPELWPALITAVILGIMSLFVVWRKYAWLASFPLAVLIGVGTGAAIRSTVETSIIGNIRAILFEAIQIPTSNLGTQLGYIVRIVFAITAIIYLLFTLFIKGPLSKPISYLSTVGKYGILVFFGLTVGNTLQQMSGLAVSAINRAVRQLLGL